MTDAEIDRLVERAKVIFREDQTSTGFGHADYPHHPGTLYDCLACESQYFCGEMGDCLFCEIQVRGELGEC